MKTNFDSNNLNTTSVNSVNTVSSANTTSAASQTNAAITAKDKYSQICEKYKITEFELQKLIELCQKENKDIFQLGDAEILELINNVKLTVEQYENVPEEQPEKTDNTSSSDNIPKEQTQSVVDYASSFNHKQYSELSNEEKLNTYAHELALNKFLFGNADNKKTLEDWNKLSDEEKQKLVENELNLLKQDKYISAISDESQLSKYLQTKMVRLQTANWHQMNIDEFNNQDNSKIKIEQAHDYLETVENKSENLNKLSAQEDATTNLLISYLKDKAASNPDIQEKFGHLWKEGNSYKLGQNEIKSYLEYINKGKDDKDKLTETDLLLEALQNEIKKDPDNQQLKIQYEKLNGLSKQFKIDVQNNVDNGMLSALETDKYFGELYKSALTTEDKIIAIEAYINEHYPNATDEEKAKLIHDFSMDLYRKGDLSTVMGFTALALTKMKGTKAEEILSKDKDAATYMSGNTDILSADAAKNVAQTQKEISEDNPEKAEILAETSQKILRVAKNQENLQATSKIYAGFGIKSVEDRQLETVLDKDAVTKETQKTMFDDIIDLSNIETGKKAAVNIDKLYSDNQISAIKKASGNKIYNDAMIADGTVVRLDEDNKIDAFKILKDRTLLDDYNVDEAKTVLKTLSNWIADKRNSAKTQSGMHKEIMSLDKSKFSDVIKHAAGNIKNYDASVQAEAINATVATGNSAAVEVAYTNLATSPSVIQESAGLSQTIVAASTYDNPDLSAKIKSGAALTREEYESLTETQKQEYRVAYFQSLSPAKQIEIITKISDVQSKKTIFKRIAQQNPSFLKNIIEHDASTAEFIYNMHIADEAVLSIAKRKSASVIQYANLVKKIEKNNTEISGKTDTQNQIKNKETAYMDSPFSVLKDKKTNKSTYIV